MHIPLLICSLSFSFFHYLVVMARFARNCMLKMWSLTKKLETKLGPGTADLTMRMVSYGSAFFLFMLSQSQIINGVSPYFRVFTVVRSQVEFFVARRLVSSFSEIP
jgi:hypothetical protein